MRKTIQETFNTAIEEAMKILPLPPPPKKPPLMTPSQLHLIKPVIPNI